MALNPGEIAARAARRALAERGLESHGRAHAAAHEVLSGVHVRIEPAPSVRSGPAPGAPRELVSASCLAEVPDGGSFAVPDGAVITPLAREEAQRRGIRLEGTRGGRLKVGVGCDHGGFAVKADVLDWIREMGHVPVDFGTRDENPVDYPDFARAVAEAVAGGQCDVGICIDGAGIGSAMAANKVPGVRAATCNDTRMAHNAREHNYANVLAFGARMISVAEARDVVRTFLMTPYGPERHARRVEKIGAIERRYNS